MSCSAAEANSSSVSPQQEEQLQDQQFPESRQETVTVGTSSTQRSLGTAISSTGVLGYPMQSDTASGLTRQIESLQVVVQDFDQRMHEMERTIQEQRGWMEEMLVTSRQQQQLSFELVSCCTDSLHLAVLKLSEQYQRLRHELRDIASTLAPFKRFISTQPLERQSSLADELCPAIFEQHNSPQEVSHVEDQQSVRDLAVANHDLQQPSLEMSSYDGVLRWKITEISRRRMEAEAAKQLSIFSPPFFSSHGGYKMCARLYFNGDGVGKGSHLSLFFVVMKGENDDVLPWPFQHPVTFRLVDQEHQRHISDTFRPDPTSSSFQRPTSSMNVASGCPLFVPLDGLETGGYVMDDAMSIRMVVDTKSVVHSWC